MIDVFFVVENLERFHSENKIMNKHHYSSMAYNMDIKSLLKFNNFGTCVMYNPFIVIGKDDDSQLIKYGVVSEDNFKNLLSNWDNLFIAGRFHKPVLSLESDALVEKIILENRGAAVIIT
jgi:translocator assembly and maintenance protein 41